MYESHELLKNTPFILIGSVSGTFVRLYVVNKLFKLGLSRHFGVLSVNLLASFCLGFALSLTIQNNSIETTYPLFLLICVGFFGTFSTFSTFICDLLISLLENRWKDAYMIIFLALFGGLLFGYIGHALGNALSI